MSFPKVKITIEWEEISDRGRDQGYLNYVVGRDTEKGFWKKFWKVKVLISVWGDSEGGQSDTALGRLNFVNIKLYQ